MNDLIIPDWFDDWFGDHFPEKEKTISPKNAWKRLNISKDRIYRAIRYGDLDAIRIGGRWTIPRPAFRQWLIERFEINR